MSPIRPHSAPVSCAASSPDGRVIASGSYDQRILLWNAASGAILRELRGHTSLVNGLAWSPEGECLASAASDYSVRLWHPGTGEELARLTGHSDDVNSVSWSPDGGRLASASFDGTVRIWRRNGSLLLIAAHHCTDVNDVTWLPDGGRLAAASDDGTVSIFDAEDGRVRRFLEGHTDWVDQVAAHPAGGLLASAGQDGTARVWRLDDGCQIACLDASTCVVKSVAWSPDGSVLAASSYDGALRLYENGSFRLLGTLNAEGLWNRTLGHTPAGWLTGSFGGGPVVLSTRGARRFGSARTAGLNGLAVAPDGSRAAVCSDDGNLYEIDLAKAQVVGILGAHREAVLCVAYAPGGQLVATGSWDRTVRVWERSTGRCLATWEGNGGPVNSLAFDARGRTLWIGTFNGTVVSWSLDGAEANLRGSHHGSVKAVAASGSAVVSAGRDGLVQLWTGNGARTLRNGGSIVNGVALDPGQTRVACVSRREGIELRSAQGQELAGFSGHPCSAKAVAWSADGQLVAGAYYDGNVALWEPGSNRVRVERISDRSLSGIAFVGDELLVSSWAEHGTLHRLDLRSGAWQELRSAA